MPAHVLGVRGSSPVLPGRLALSVFVHTSDIQHSCWLQTNTFGTEMTPIGRPAQPAEYGPPAVFLATETDSSYVVGAILSVTGGMLIN